MSPPREPGEDGPAGFALVTAFDAGSRGGERPLVVALHARGGDAASGIAHARAVLGDEPDVVALQAARPCNPLQSNLRAAQPYAGFSWYLGADPCVPEAASFGDALAQLDLFASSMERPFVLVGEGQGAVLAVTLALFAPARLVAVHARGAAMARIDGWSAPERDLRGIEFRLHAMDGAEHGEAVAGLRRRGARVPAAGDDSPRPSAPVRASILVVLLLLGMPAPAPALSTGPQPAVTGVPAIGTEAAEGTCVQCHNSSPINPDDQVAMTLEGVPASYEPGRTYTLTLRLVNKDATRLRWGFQLTAVAMKDGAGAGELIVTDAGTTQVIQAMSGTRSYVEHGYGGTAIGQTGGASWTFDWKAPPAGVGKVGFFAAANAANADGSNQGDHVYTRSPLPLAESKPAGS